MLTYEERSQYCQNPTGIKLFQLMAEKKTNLAISLDVTKSADLIHLADLLGPEICILKTHIDIVDDFSQALTAELQALASRHDFIIFEDRKFADIGNTVKHQYGGGLYHIASWAPITNAHTLPGSSIIEGMKEVGLSFGNGLLLLAQMSTKGNLFTDQYTKQTIDLALSYPEFVIGFICQQKLSQAPHLIHMTPGVQLSSLGDNLGQQYISPKTAIFERDNDLIIVGRGIYKAKNPLEAARHYREQGWQAYQAKFR